MGLEIERRFLVEGAHWRSHVRWLAHLRQGYLGRGEGGLTLRVRTSRPESANTACRAWLTLKALPPGGGEGLTRLEFEYAIPPEDGEALLALTERQLDKWRHGLDLPGGDWVLDVFEGANAPLVVAEVELAAPDQHVTVPPWCVREITGRHELSNAALAERPLGSWTEEERRTLWS